MKNATVDSALEPPAQTTVPSVGPLGLPIPDRCSDQYAAGWAIADALIAKGCNQDSGRDVEWHSEKVAGFLDRQGAERQRKYQTHAQSGLGELKGASSGIIPLKLAVTKVEIA